MARLSLQTPHPLAQAFDQPRDRFDGVGYFTPEQARVYAGKPSIVALNRWLQRHRIRRCGDGTISRKAIDRAKAIKRQLAASSLANLRRGVSHG